MSDEDERMKPVSVSMAPSMERQIERYVDGQDRSAFIREAVREKLNKLAEAQPSE